MALHQPSIALRAARATFDEGLVFARYLDQAAEGFFRFMLGRRAADIIATAYLQPDHDLSYQHITFAQRDGVVVGMASGYTAVQHRRSSLGPLKQAAGKRALRMRTVTLLCGPLLRIIDTVADGDFYLQAIAVDKDLRGQGLGATLLEAIEAQGRTSGSTRLALDVSAKNHGARRFYDRHGLTVASQWPRRLVIPGLRLLRMTKPL